MSNEYFEHDTKLKPGTKARAEDVNSRFDGVVEGMEKLPAPHATLTGFADPVAVGAPTSTEHAVSVEQALGGGVGFGVDTGAVNAYVVDLPVAPVSYREGLIVSFTAVNGNTGASTMNLNGLGAKTLSRPDGTPLANGDIADGQLCSFAYDGANFRASATFAGQFDEFATAMQGQVDTAEAHKDSAAASELQTGLDMAAVAADLAATNQDTIDTAADLAATNQDTIDTAADLAATNQDTIDTAADVVQTGTDATTATAQAGIATTKATAAEQSHQDALAIFGDAAAVQAAVDAAEADKVQTGLDRTAVAADLVQTNQDTIDTAADATQTGTDRAQTGSDRTAVAADLVRTNQDSIDTAADLVQTAQDTTDTAADRVQTGLDRVATAADKVATNQDALDIAADAAQTGIDRTAVAADLVATNQDTIDTAADAVQTGLDATTATTQAGIATTKAADASTTYDDTIALLGELAEPEILERIEKVLAGITGTVVRAFRYDTTKDSDGGAWRERCQALSWYNEELNTATRGASRKFPAVVAVVAEANKVTLFDLTDPTAPMWMVFKGDVPNMFRGSDKSGCAAINGLLVTSNTNVDLQFANFLLDEGGRYSTAGVARDYQGNVAQRNDALDFGGSTTPVIVDRIVNDVTMTILDDAPIDPETGIAVPTIAVATDGGVSIIDGPAGVGTVVDITGQSGDIRKISFNDDNSITTHYKYYSQVATYELPSVDINYITGERNAYTTSSSSIPALLTGASLVIAIEKTNIGHNTGLTLIDEVAESVAYITDEYNTGWLKGDIRLATLSDTVAGNITSVDPVEDRCVKNNPLQVVGTITKTPVATGAELVAYSGFSATDYLERDSADYADTQYLIGWEKNATTGWEFKSGVASTLPVDGVTITGTVLRIEGTLPKALVRLTATAPTDAEILDIYNQEKLMFREDAKCTLQGDSTSVQALDYDELTDQLYAGTADGVTTFRGLLAIDHLKEGVDVISVSAGKGAHFIASASEVHAYVPAINLREEMARIDEQSKAYGEALEDYWFTGDAVETDFTLPFGYKPKHIYDSGLIKRPDTDYTVTYDGFYYTVSFTVAPASSSDVCILAQRSV